MNEVINVTYQQREAVMRQIAVLFKDLPENKKVAAYEEVFNLEAKEREAIRQVKTTKTGDAALKEEIAIMTSITNQLDALCKEHYYAHQNQMNEEIRTEGLPNNVLK